MRGNGHELTKTSTPAPPHTEPETLIHKEPETRVRGPVLREGWPKGGIRHPDFPQLSENVCGCLLSAPPLPLPKKKLACPPPGCIGGPVTLAPPIERSLNWTPSFSTE